jgi:ubiquinone/menaquinone biosynthesis C-methylase UbiE
MLIDSFHGLNVLDAGCGEGKNAMFLARRGANVLGVDVSATAIDNGKRSFFDSDRVTWKVADILDLSFHDRTLDVVLAYGLFHCLPCRDDIQHVVNALQQATKKGGFHVICCFNSRYQELGAHPGFKPTLLPHQAIADYYEHWELVHSTDTDLVESHPNNQIQHRHSMTRVIARRPTG